MNDTPSSPPKPSAVADKPVIKATAPADGQRGLLDLSVELSTRDLTAGEEFALYVLVKNPFTHPVWVERVHLSLPSELINPKKEELQRQISSKLDAEIQEIQKDREFYKTALAQIENRLPADEGGSAILAPNDIQAVKTTMAEIKRKLTATTAKMNFLIFDIDVDLSTQMTDKLKCIAATRELDLDSSLSADLALQPSSTAVYTAVLNVKRPLFRPPSKFRLQISVVYSLGPYGKEAPTFANTISHEVTIRPALKSLLYGASLGGIFGAIGRMLQIGDVNLELVTWSSALSFLVSIVLAVLLSAIAIIFMARKSDAQPFISVEDFWGGLLIGFLVGYTGTSFFTDLTHIEPPKVAE